MRRGWVVGVSAVGMACAACGGGGTNHAGPTTCPTLSQLPALSPQSIPPSSPATASTTKPSCLPSTSSGVPASGQDWKGTVDMEARSNCPSSAKGQVEFGVDSTGQVQGTVTGDYMVNQDACNDPKADASGSGTWPVIGRRTGQEFQLTFYPARTGAGLDGRLDMPVTVPIVSANTASAQGTDLRQESVDGPVYRTYAINLTCTNC
jgi:hypothetical protein